MLPSEIQPQTQKNPIGLRDLHGQRANLGILEKYLNGTLGSQEWLTEVDIERMLQVMGLRQAVHITRFDLAEIGTVLHFEREAHKESSQPYTIPFILNKGSEGESPGVHWFSATITVDPAKHEISYKVIDSMSLTAEQKQEIQRCMQSAICYNETSTEKGVTKNYQAFPNWSIVGSEIIGTQQQQDGYSCGYRALHAIINEPGLAAVVNSNIEAKGYADCVNGTNSLVQYVYKKQLSDLVVPQQVIAELQRQDDFMPAPIMAGGETGDFQLKPKKINECLAKLDEIDWHAISDQLVLNTDGKYDFTKVEKAFHAYIECHSHVVSKPFYTEALRAIQATTFDVTVKAQLAALLAAATTDDNSRLFAESAGSREQSLKQWQYILTTLAKITTPFGLGVFLEKMDGHCSTMQAKVVYELGSLKTIPALPVLTKLIDLIDQLCREVGLLNAADMGKKVKTILDTLGQATAENYKNALYNGMRFYDADDYAPTGMNSIFFTHLQTTQAIINKFNQKQADQPSLIVVQLMRLISAFHLTNDDVAKIQLSEEFVKSKAVQQGLQLLVGMDLPTGKPGKLKVTDLNELLQNLQAIDNASNLADAEITQRVKAVIKNKVSAYFAAGFFDSDTSVVSQAADFSFESAVKLNTTVEKSLSKYTDFDNEVIFPNKKDETLAVADYKNYLFGLQQKLQKNSKFLDKLILSPCSAAALYGLEAVMHSITPRFGELMLKIDDVAATDTRSFLDKFKELLLVADKKQLPKLAMVDINGVITPAQWEGIGEFIVENKLTMDLLLPADFQNTKIQRDIDRAVSTNIRERAIKSVGKVASEKAEDQPDKSKQLKRTRPHLNPLQNLNVDIELQQEQQIEVAVASAKIKVGGEDEADVGDLDVIKIDNFAGFFARLSGNKKFDIPTESRFLSKDDAQKNWNIWFGHITSPTGASNGLNTSIAGVTVQACEQLLNYPEQFKLGVDFHHLPVGFALVDYPAAGGMVLHYDKYSAVLKSKLDPDPLAPVLKAQPRTQVLAYPVVDELIKQLEKGSERDKLIVAQWAKLQQAEQYDRKAEELFRQHLPKLLSFSKEQLETLFKLAFDSVGNKLHAVKFDFIVRQLPTIARVLPNEFVADTQPAKVLLELFDLSEAKQVVGLAKSYTKDSYSKYIDPKQISNDHLLFKLLIGKTKLVEQIKDWGKQLSFSDFNLDALLQVYNKQGEAGIELLFSKWDAIDLRVLQALHNVLFKHAESYMLLLDEKYTSAVNAAKTFSGNQKIWWDILLSKHGQAVGYDDLSTLVEAFKAFNKAVKDKGLDFYAISTESFGDVTNMSVAMARMLTILNECPEADLKTQWECISQLSLQSNGAIRAITDTKSNAADKCGFVLPEMQAFSGAYDAQHGYKAADDWKEIGRQQGPAKVKENFYRYIASQKYRLPALFYQQAFAAVDKKKFDPTVTARLLALLVASTTGASNSFSLDTADESLQQWNNMLEILENPAVPMLKTKARNGLVESLFSLSVPPSLPVFGKLLMLINQTVGKAGWSPVALNVAGEKLWQTCADLNVITTHYQNAIYDGMWFYGDEHYAQAGDNSIFYTHIKAARAVIIDRGFSEKRKLIMRLISTFQLTAENIATLTLVDSFNSNQQKGIIYALQLLTQLEKNISKQGEKLTVADLKSLLDALKNDAVSKENKEKWSDNTTRELRADEIIKATIVAKLGADCFAKDFFDKLHATAIPADVVTWIGSNFTDKSDQNAVTLILGKFIQSGESLQYMSIVQKISAIVKSKSANEKKNFFANLQIENLYKPSVLGQKPTIAQFSVLLDAIIARGHADDFIYLLAQDEAKTTNGLLEKATLYLTTILPGIENNKSDTVSKMDVLALVTQLLLVSSVSSLSNEVDVERKDKQFFSDIIGVLAGLTDAKDVDLSQLQRDITAFKNEKNSVKFKNLDILLCDVEELKKPKPVQAVSVPIQTLGESLVEKAENLKEQVVSVVTSVWGRLFGRDESSKADKPQDQVVPAVAPPISAVVPTENIKADRSEVLKKDILAALNEINEVVAKRKTYDGVFQDAFNVVYQIAEKYPGAKDLIIDFVKNYVRGYKEDNLIVDIWNCISTLQQEFIALGDADTIRSLCYHYSGIEGEFTPARLLEILNDNNFKQLDKDDKKLLLNIISVLLNNDKHFTAAEFTDLVGLCNDEEYGPTFLKQLAIFYKTAPYPTLAQVMLWHRGAKANSETAQSDKNQAYERTLNGHYDVYSKHPCTREFGEEGVPKEKSVNGFNYERDKSRAIPFLKAGLSDDDFLALSTHTAQVRDLEIRDLITEFQTFKSSKHVDYSRLLAIAAELLYRSKGTEAELAGSSFEINSTQYLAILAMLKSGGHVTSEIATGEGKSRIMMISCACQFALGNTVDFVTSDVQLATRDYLEYQAYFKMIGAQTNLISADTPVSEYRQHGINFSDPSNLSLFRNKARSSGNGANVIDQDPKKRALLLDEADKTYFDVADTRFNYSTAGDETIKGIEWVYPLLIDFFDAGNYEYNNLYYNDMDQCNAKLYEFAATKCTAEQVARLKALPTAQIESWQDSAKIALALEFDKDFTIEADTTIVTPRGPKKASEAKLIAGNRVAKHAKFSFGVHQCLHARLNMLREKSVELVDPVSKKLSECKQPFHIEAEKQIVYSSSSKTLIDDYNEGDVLAVTGTAGSMIERQEAGVLYGKEDGADMKFISVPRHNGLQRIDRPVSLTADNTGQIKALVEYIQEARRNDQPVLVICDNDKDSQTMYEALERALQNKLPVGPNVGMQRIHSQMSIDAERDAIEAAGLNRMVTVSTGMIGRGTDIKLQGVTKEQGLKVLLTYLPRERDMMQMLGRSGRFGARGDTRIVLNKQELKHRLGKTTLNEGFYTAPETYLRRQQFLMDRRKQCERLIKNTVSDFNRKLTNNYFEMSFDESKRKDILPAWSKFMKDKDQAWNEIWSKIISVMNETNPNSKLINEQLDIFKVKTQGLWDELHSSIKRVLENTDSNSNPSSASAQQNPQSFTDQLVPGKSENKIRGNVPTPAEIVGNSLRKEVGELQLDEKVTKLLAEFDVTQLVPHQVKIHDKYDPSFAGRATVYSKLFVEIKALFSGERKFFASFRAWKAGHGILFANLRAWWRGDISFGQFLFSYGSKHAINAKVPTHPSSAQVDKSAAINGGSTSGITKAVGGPTGTPPVSDNQAEARENSTSTNPDRASVVASMTRPIAEIPDQPEQHSEI